MSAGLQRWKRRFDKLRHHPKPLRLLASRALWHSGLSSWFVTELPDGLKIRFYPSSISAALWVEQSARSDDEGFLKALLRPGDRYIDCGANIGHLALVARACIGASGSVLAIEANPRIYGYCVENVRLNGFSDVRSINCAIGEREDTIEISDRRADDQNRVGGGGARVPLHQLDNVADSSPVTLLKIDVEGYELQVLQGARNTLARTSFVYCELSASNAARFGYEPRDAEELLIEGGFILAHERDGAWRLSRKSIFDSLDETERPRTGYNLVAIRATELSVFESRMHERGRRVTG